MNEPKVLKPFPTFATDEEAEAFVAGADLTEYDFSGFRRAHFEFVNEGTEIILRVPSPLLDAIKGVANERGISFTRYIRETLERDIARNKA